MTDWAYIICISKANNASSLNPNKNHLIHGLHEAHKEIIIIFSIFQISQIIRNAD